MTYKTAYGSHLSLYTECWFLISFSLTRILNDIQAHYRILDPYHSAMIAATVLTAAFTHTRYPSMC